MISRRNIRVKVMQLLYMMETAIETQSMKNPINELQKYFDKSRDLFVYIIFFITEVAKYAEKDAVNKANKHLPTTADLNINTKLSGNQLLWTILENESFKKALEEINPSTLLNQNVLRRVYNSLIEAPEYKVYINQQSRDKQAEKDILRFIFTHLMLPDEVFTSHLEELFTNWDDDGDMMDLQVNAFLSKPNNYNFQVVVSDDKWQFAKSLFITTFNKRNHLLEIIKPKLKNWDADRIAQLDMVIMQMGVCEFLYFDTIPTKVTINECIDLAKDYSTNNSGHFVNGILDNIHKELVSNDDLNKIDFKRK